VKEFIQSITERNKQVVPKSDQLPKQKASKKRMKRVLDDLFESIVSSPFVFAEKVVWVGYLDRVLCAMSSTDSKPFFKRLYRTFRDKWTFAIGLRHVLQCCSSNRGNVE
jgi:hypothetical protein